MLLFAAKLLGFLVNWPQSFAVRNRYLHLFWKSIDMCFFFQVHTPICKNTDFFYKNWQLIMLHGMLHQCQESTWNTYSTVSFLSIEIPKKVFGGFDNIFHVYLMRGFQKYKRNWILMVAFRGQTKAGQKYAVRWAELAVLFCR